MAALRAGGAGRDGRDGDPVRPPADIIDQAAGRYSSIEVLRELRRAGWHLIHVDTEAHSELGVHHVETIRVALDGEIHNQRFMVPEQRLEHHPDPEGPLEWERKRAWQRIGVTIGEKLGALHERTREQGRRVTR